MTLWYHPIPFQTLISVKVHKQIYIPFISMAASLHTSQLQYFSRPNLDKDATTESVTVKLFLPQAM